MLLNEMCLRMRRNLQIAKSRKSTSSIVIELRNPNILML